MENEQLCLSNKESINIDKGLLLEYRIKRLFYHMGYFTKNNIILKTATQEPCDIITDLDVYGITFLKDFSFQTSWIDCKSGKADVLKHISWINGVKNKFSIDDVIFIKKGVRKSSKEYAQSLGIRVCDLDIISKLENNYNINPNDWSGSYDFNFLEKQSHTFSNIAIPDIKHYKNIFSFYISTYWILDSFTQVKKCLSGMKQLIDYYNLPLSREQKLSIKWMIFSFISYFLLSTFKICGQFFYFDDKTKRELLLEGLMSGNIPISKQNELKNVAFKMASEIIKQSIPDFDSTVFNQAIKNNPPYYFDAYYNLILKISDNPELWYNILNTFDYIMMEYELKGELRNDKIIKNINDKICIKTIIYFLCDVVGLPKETFPFLLA